ncbi:hypothetical protein AHF37_05229 [Paragonimus kellicotti]|nr:hypothetical protein AHF37_05229 [Paragonimus kellicotti]
MNYYAGSASEFMPANGSSASSKFLRSPFRCKSVLKVRGHVLTIPLSSNILHNHWLRSVLGPSLYHLFTQSILCRQ